MIRTEEQLTFEIAEGWLTELADYHESHGVPLPLRPIDVTKLRKIAELLRSDPCLMQLERGEPWFTLRAHDELAPLTVAYWAQLASGSNVHEPEKIAEATECAVAMTQWQLAHVEV